MRLSDGLCRGKRVLRGLTMEVFAVTIFMSLLFAVLFSVLFFAERTQRNRTSIEQMSLMPLDDGPAALPAKTGIREPGTGNPL